MKILLIDQNQHFTNFVSARVHAKDVRHEFTRACTHNEVRDLMAAPGGPFGMIVICDLPSDPDGKIAQSLIATIRTFNFQGLLITASGDEKRRKAMIAAGCDKQADPGTLIALLTQPKGL